MRQFRLTQDGRVKTRCYPGIQMLLVTSFLSLNPLLPDCSHPHECLSIYWQNKKRGGNPLSSQLGCIFYSTDIIYLMREQKLWNVVIRGPSCIIHMATLHCKGHHSKGWGWRKRKVDRKLRLIEHVGPFTSSLISSVDLDLVRSSPTLAPTLRCRLPHWVSFCLSWLAANLICLLTQISVEPKLLIKAEGRLK